MISRRQIAELKQLAIEEKDCRREAALEQVADEVIWVSPEWCDPPHVVSHPDKLEELKAAFAAGGWNPASPSLIGYRQGRRVQLLSGSHRWRAAIEVGLSHIPVVVRSWEKCYAAFGDLRRWRRLMAAPAAQRP